MGQRREQPDERGWHARRHRPHGRCQLGELCQLRDLEHHDLAALMLDGRSRVTVIGAHRRVDVALPATAPIGEYSAGLASLCGQDSHRALPPAGSLAAAGAAPMPLSASLAESGVVDGQVLYLRDLARDPGADATVEDIPELIAGEAETQRRGGWPRALVVITFGLAWLAAAAGFAFRRPGAGLITPAVSLIVAGLALLAIGWALAQRRVLAPAALCVLTSLTAVPCLAVAGALLGQALAGRSFLWVGAIGGARPPVPRSPPPPPPAAVPPRAPQPAPPPLPPPPPPPRPPPPPPPPPPPRRPPPPSPTPHPPPPAPPIPHPPSHAPPPPPPAPLTRHPTPAPRAHAHHTLPPTHTRHPAA